MLQAEGGGRVQSGESVGELFQRTADSVVLRVVRRVLDGVAAEDGGFAVGGVGFVGCEVDFAEESVKGEEGVSLCVGVGWARDRGAYFCSWCLSLRTMTAVIGCRRRRKRCRGGCEEREFHRHLFSEPR